jgi:GNAT superfamily N-acetyltransferase
VSAPRVVATSATAWHGRSVDELERIALDPYRPVYGRDAIEVGGATCLRARAAPESPMLNRVVGLGIESDVEEGGLDAALGVMDGTTFYVAVSPTADRQLDPLLERRGLEPGWGWMLFERHALPPPRVDTPLDVTEVDRGRADDWARVVATGYELPEQCLPMLARVPGLEGWTAFLALEGGRPAAAAAVWTNAPAAYFGFAATLPEHRGKGGQGALLAARIERALEAGCTTLVTETGELREGSPSASYRNILRYGFEERYVVAHRVGRPAIR